VISYFHILFDSSMTCTNPCHKWIRVLTVWIPTILTCYLLVIVIITNRLYRWTLSVSMLLLLLWTLSLVLVIRNYYNWHLVLYQRWKLKFVWYVLLSVKKLGLSNNIFAIHRYIDELLFVYLWQEILLLICITSCSDAKLRWRFWICVIVLRIFCKVRTRSHFELIIISLLLLWRLANISMKKLLRF
jgi:hypothetical protein